MDQLSPLGDFLKQEPHKDVRSNEATMKYLLMGRVSSSILVHGFSWLYGSSGGEIELQEIVKGLINIQMYNSPGISIALILYSNGFDALSKTIGKQVKLTENDNDLIQEK
ncbi:hypothetical protein R3W88_017156 [Solanum pinnatisectum]|uniref:NADH:quinone oxidoreductase/Mrp antiporter transmembrane domain-containing protein n=1 Tax=Solanum pinnatisectum TaxID=50273 RepID=A0AAV9L095_9SOLN|nr:hypothetical protein R3W88_017156 [Solanum pinnatisectum]